MTDLQECRRQIDEIDSEILRLFEKRMKVSEDVANYKIRTGKPVFDAVREREKLKSLGEQAHGEFNALGIQEVFQQIMPSAANVSISFSLQTEKKRTEITKW